MREKRREEQGLDKTAENEMIWAIPVRKQPRYQQKSSTGPALCPAGMGFTGFFLGKGISRHQQEFGVCCGRLGIGIILINPAKSAEILNRNWVKARNALSGI